MGARSRSLTPGFSIRPATKADLDAIVSVEEESFEFPWPVEAFQKELGNRWSTTEVVLSDGGRIVAFAVYWIVADELHLLDIAVMSSHRRRGLAQAVVVHLEDICRRRELNYLTLEVRVSNEAAINLYEAAGFVTIHRRKKYYVDNHEDALVMAKVLRKSDDGDVNRT